MSPRGVAVQVDGSGSMTGFHQTGELDRLVGQVKVACNSANLPCGVMFFVSEKPHQVVWKDQASVYQGSWGNYTNLEQAFITGIGQAPIKVMLTDNVQAANDQDARTLYAKFGQDTVKVLDAVPLRRQFSGRLFSPLLGNSAGLPELRSLNRDAVIEKTDSPAGNQFHYTGDRGFILYLYLTDSKARSSYERLLDALKSGGMEPVRLKPVDDSIVLHASGIPKIEASIQRPTQVSFRFTLESKFSHVNIVPGRVGGPEVNLKVQPPRVKAVWDQDHVFFDRHSSHGTVTPPMLKEVLESNTQNRYVYRCDVSLGPFRPTYRGLFDYLGMARFSPIPASYAFSVSMTIPPDAFQMTRRYQETYFTENPGVLNRIYTPVDIIQYLHTKPLLVLPQYGGMAGKFTVNPPVGPLVAWGFLFIFALILGGVLIYLAHYPLRYRWTDIAQQGREFEKSFLGPWARKPPLTYQRADGTELCFGHFTRPLQHFFTFLFIPVDGVRVEDQRGELIFPSPVEGREVLSPDPAGTGRHLKLEMEKKLILKQEEVELTLERIPRLREDLGRQGAP